MAVSDHIRHLTLWHVTVFRRDCKRPYGPWCDRARRGESFGQKASMAEFVADECAQTSAYFHAGDYASCTSPFNIPERCYTRDCIQLDLVLGKHVTSTQFLPVLKRGSQWIMCVITMLPAAHPTWKPQIQGLLVSGMIVGTIVAEVTCSGTLSDTLVRRFSSGVVERRRPEVRLWLLLPAVSATALGLVLFALTQQYNWHWAIGQTATAIFAFGVQVGNTVVSTYVVDCYPDHVMSIIAFYSVHLNLSAFASPFWIVPQVNRMGWGWTFGSEALITVAFAAAFLPVMILWGSSLRSWRGPLIWNTTRHVASG